MADELEEKTITVEIPLPETTIEPTPEPESESETWQKTAEELKNQSQTLSASLEQTIAELAEVRVELAGTVEAIAATGEMITTLTAELSILRALQETPQKTPLSDTLPPDANESDPSPVEPETIALPEPALEVKVHRKLRPI